MLQERTAGAGCVQLVRNYRGQLIRLVSNASVVRYGDPPFAGRQLEPFFIARVWSEVVGVTFDTQARISEDAWELQTQVAIREEDNTQAARSYTTARSTSSGVRP